MSEFKRACHQRAFALLKAMDAQFLRRTQCYFGGGTRLAMELGEYRASNDVDFVCSDRDGWRSLRGTVTNRSLGALFVQTPRLAREVRTDRDAIRTFVEVAGTPVKLEFIREGNIALGGEASTTLPVHVVEKTSSVAQKLLANTDRGTDHSHAFKDLVDLAFAAHYWDDDVLRQGWTQAAQAYGERVIRNGFVQVVHAARQDPQRWGRHLDAFDVERGDERLRNGLGKLAQLCGTARTEKPALDSTGVVAAAHAVPGPAPMTDARRHQGRERE